MPVTIDNISKILAVISSFLAILKIINSGILKTIESQREQGIPKLEDVDINILNEMEYYDISGSGKVDNSGKNNLKNSLIFRKITNKNAPIHIVNLIFNCYDPAEAIYIYARAEKYINFNNHNRLEKPRILERKNHKFLLNLLFYLALLSLATNILLVILCTQFLLIVIKNFEEIQSKSPNSVILILSILLVFTIVAYVSTIFSFRMLDDSLSGLRLYKKAINFYDTL